MTTCFEICPEHTWFYGSVNVQKKKPHASTHVVDVKTYFRTKYKSIEVAYVITMQVF
jgi:hypothetical protein